MKSSCFVANASPLGRWDAMGPKLPKRLSHLSCITLRLASRTSERPNVLLFSCACCRNVLNEDEESGKVPLHHSCSTGAKHWDTHPPTPPPLPLSLLLCSITHQYNIGASDVYARPLTCSGWDFLRWYSLPFGTAGWTRQFMFIFKVVRPENLQKQWQPATLAQDRNKRREQLQGASRVNLSRGRSRHI